MFFARLLLASLPVAVFGVTTWFAFLLIGASYGVGAWILDRRPQRTAESRHRD